MKLSSHVCCALFITALIGLAGCHAARESAPAPMAETASVAKAERNDASLADAPVLAPPSLPAPLMARQLPSAAMAPSLDRVEVRGSHVAAVGYFAPVVNTENYAYHRDNSVQRTSEQPLSTFSIDVDSGSYSNVRRMLNEGLRPPADAVRAEEFINYFDYAYPAPAARDVPFRVSTELAPAPWNAQRQVLMIGIKGFDVPKATLPPANLVFLIDTSGSMDSPDKLPLVKASLRQLVPQLHRQDRVSMVVYAGSAGLVLPPTPGDRHDEILSALDRLDAGGSTNGGDGIRLAYAMAKQAFVKGGVNRVILASDGDFNVGTVDQNALETLVADQRKSGIALTTLGFGSGNYNDALAEQLADVGDGNHAYIDSLLEARKVLVEEMGSTLLTIARDVKVQVEFNPAQVAEYRLIGYENRVLQREDFANDRVDAGDIGAGHEVTALYEITPVASSAQRLPTPRYGDARPTVTTALGGEMAHLRLRYKRPGEDRSHLIETPILVSQLSARPSESLRFATAVAGFADALRGGSRFEGWSWEAIARTAQAARGRDRSGERAKFVRLVEQARRQIENDATAALRVSE
ncbi:von Willebrand factor type A domain-containing protein [Lysobacter cavernae]|uniref:von Willebrand factor type A domain-containing protein n=1 Tax=Lysobacter cavernae TaxID=1685901 RepID=A0ABV7RS88_9GAMM